MAVCCSGYNQLRPVSDHCPWMPPRRSSRRSSRVAWTTATHCCSALATHYFIACSRCRTLPPTWSQAFVGVTTSHQCYSSCTGCQSVGTLCSRLRGSYISRLLERLPRTLQPTVAFFFYQTVVWCKTLVVAHCSPTPMSCESCLCHEHITNSEFLGCWSTVEWPSTWTMATRTDLRLLQTISENSFIWLPKCL